MKLKQIVIGGACVLSAVACAKDPVPYSSTTSADHTKSPDNTRVNERDRGGTLTPLDQGNSDAEIRISAAIRDALMRDATLSVTGKNVKVITVGTKVTLRGPTQSDDEKSTIGALAQKTAGVNEVDNQLEVKK